MYIHIYVFFNIFKYFYIFYVYYKITHWRIYLVHHTIFILSWILISYLDREIYRYFIRMLLAELSGFTLNIRSLAKIYKYEKLDLSMSLVTYILFFIFALLKYCLGIGFIQLFWSLDFKLKDDYESEKNFSFPTRTVF